MDPASSVVSLWPAIVLMIGIAWVALGIAILRIHPFYVLCLAAVLVGLLSGGVPSLFEGPRLLDVLGLTLSELYAMALGVGFVILLAAVIGMCMLRSGAADRIVTSAVSVFGEDRAPLALLFAGFFLAIPVFFDTVFFLLLPLARALSIRMGRHYVLYILAIGAGGAVAHCLVAPTPGPLIMAEVLQPIGVDLGSSIVAGILAGLLPAAVMLYVARLVDARQPVAVPHGMPADGTRAGGPPVGDVAPRGEDMPPLALSILPVIVPVSLITTASVVELMDASLGVTAAGNLTVYIKLFGDKNIAMLIGALLAAYVFAHQRNMDLRTLVEAMRQPVATGAVIVLITSAGGAFGAMVRHSGVGEVIRVIALDYNVDLVLLSWLVAALIRVAQGSSTVAMITSANLMTAIVGDMSGLSVHPLYIFLAIGFGSLFCSWMNDSGFWVVGRLSGFSERETLKTWTLTTVVLSLVGLAQLWVISHLLPFA